MNQSIAARWLVAEQTRTTASTSNPAALHDKEYFG
jgi:hypothetical protein